MIEFSYPTRALNGTIRVQYKVTLLDHLVRRLLVPDGGYLRARRRRRASPMARVNRIRMPPQNGKRRRTKTKPGTRSSSTSSPTWITSNAMRTAKLPRNDPRPTNSQKRWDLPRNRVATS